ncbi:MAG: PEP-CTERM sorting domain-containing protein [Bryobacteraceae bacterium]
MKLLGAVFSLMVGIVVTGNQARAIPVTPQNYSFNFQGACTIDCTGLATGVLTLQDYVIGDYFSETNFVSLSYSSNFTQFLITNTDPGLAASGVINGLGQGSVYIANLDHYFSSSLDGFFCVDDSNFCNFSQNADAGIEGIYSVAQSRVPEPGSLALAAVGLAGLVLAGRRRSARTSSALR